MFKERSKYFHAMPYIAAFAAAAISCCCTSGVPPEHRIILSMHPELRARKVATLAMAEQIDVYLSAMATIHPPPIGLSRVVARSGEEILPLVVDRIIETPHEYEVVDLLLVVEGMQLLRYASISADAATMGTLRGRVAQLRDPAWRRMGERILEGIATGRVAPERSRKRFEAWLRASSAEDGEMSAQGRESEE